MQQNSNISRSYPLNSYTGSVPGEKHQRLRNNALVVSQTTNAKKDKQLNPPTKRKQSWLMAFLSQNAPRNAVNQPPKNQRQANIQTRLP